MSEGEAHRLHCKHLDDIERPDESRPNRTADEEIAGFETFAV